MKKMLFRDHRRLSFGNATPKSVSGNVKKYVLFALLSALLVFGNRASAYVYVSWSASVPPCGTTVNFSGSVSATGSTSTSCGSGSMYYCGSYECGGYYDFWTGWHPYYCYNYYNVTYAYVTSYSWNFGDGTSSYEMTPVHTYSAPGTYTVTLYGYDNLGYSNYYTSTVTVSNAGTITGPSTVCQGSTITLSASATGGTWSSSSGVALVNSSGHVTGNADGVANISYTVSGGCAATKLVTVYGLPTASPITGNTTLSTAITTLLGSATTGGTWTSSNTGVATINSSTGLVSGVSAGSSLISYTLGSGGCTTTMTTNVTVNTPHAGLNFDGTNDYVSVPNNTSFESSTGTVEMWVKPTWSAGTKGGNPCLASMRPSTISNTRWSFHMNDALNGIGLYNGSSYSTVGYSFTSNTWYHVAFVFSTSNCAVYINGVFIGNTGNGVNMYAGNELRIGKPDDAYVNELWTGSIDEVRLWNVQRTQTQIANNMNCDVAQNSNLVAYYRFNNGTANGTNTGNISTPDYSGNNNCGTLNNMALTGTASNYVSGAVGSCNAIELSLAAITGPSNVCVGSTITLANTVGGGSWSSSSDLASVTAGGIISGLSAGSVNISYTACGITAVKTITVDGRPALEVTPGDEICFGATTTLNVSGADTYSWSPSATLSSSAGAEVIASPTATTTYTVTGVNAMGCVNTTTTTVIVNPLPTLFHSNDTTICAGSTITMSATGDGEDYQWFSISESMAIDSNTIIVAPTETTVFLAGGINFSTGCYTIDTVTVSVNPSPTVSAGEDVTICMFDVTSLSPTGAEGLSYSWSPLTGIIGSLPPMILVNPEETTTYTVTATNEFGCTSSDDVTVTVNPRPEFTTSADTAICLGESAVLTAMGTEGTTFTWSTTGLTGSGDATIETIPTGPSYTATPTETTTYWVIATNEFGCTSQQSITVDIKPLPEAGEITGDTTVNMAGTTTLYNEVEDGTWSASNSHATVSSTGVVTGVSAGTVTISYSVTNDCGTDVATWLMHVNTPIVAGTPIICMGATTTLTGVPAGGTWTSSNTPLAVVNAAGVVTGLSTGTVNISYNVGGSITVTNVTVNTTPSVFTGSASICNASSTTLGTTPSGGTWTSSEPAIADITSTGILSGLSLGNAVISYTLSNGCARSVVATVNAIPGEISGITNICVGGTTTLSNSVPGGVFSSGNSSIATCTAGGTVAGVAAGSTLISYSIGGCRVTTLVSVTAAPAISGTPAACVGATTSLSNTTTGGVWSSGNDSVASVNAAGIVTGVSGGTAIISYSLSSGCVRTQTVTINATPVIGGASSVCIGSTANLTSAPATTSWNSSNPSAATITASGVITGVALGTTTISVISAAGCSNTAVFSVNSLPTISGTLATCVSGTTSLTGAATGGTWSSSNTGIASVNASTGVVTASTSVGTSTISYSLGAGCVRTAVVSVNGLPAITGSPAMCVSGTVALAGSPSGGTWSSADPLTATVSGTGVVTGQASGTTSIMYTNATTGCSRSVVATVNASPGAFSGTTSICMSTTTTLTNAVPGGTWSSSNTGLASAGVSTGIITGVGVGTPNIIYRIGTCQASVPVTVKALPANIGGSMQTVVGATATLTDATPGGTWSSTNTATGTISATGVLTGLAAGTSSVVYTATNGCTKSAIVTVNAAPVLPGPRSVCVGSTINIYMSGVSSWSSSTPSVATVSAGIVTGIAPGTSTITYVLTAGGYATTEVTVLAVPANITGTPSVCMGLTTALGNTTPGGAWTSSNGGLATVNASGVVTGVNNGVATITYSLATGCRKTLNVTVNLLPAAITGASTVCVGASMYPYLASPSSGTWSSSNIAIATVPSTHGQVAGVSAGVALISLTNAAGCSTTKEITVVSCPSRGMLAGTTGVTNLNGDLNISLYPNPTKGTFSVNTPEAGTLSVSTIDGREVMKRDVKAGVTELALPSDITTGVYMCRFTGEAGAATTVRLVFERD